MKFIPNPKTTPVNFCGVDLLVREWNLKQRLEIESFAHRDVSEVKDRFRELLIDCLFDVDGNKVNAADLDELPYSQVEELLKHALTINGINNDKVSELAKN